MTTSTSYGVHLRRPMRGIVTSLALLVAACQSPTEVGLARIVPIVNPAVVDLAQGQSADVSVSLPRAPVGGTVNWSATTPTQGITTRFGAPGPGGSGSTLTLVAGSTLEPGTYHLTITATVTGLATEPVELDVTVSAPNGGGLVQLVTGNAFACGRTPTNAVWCWGQNQAGQIGDGTTTHRLTPVAIQTPLPLVRLEAGEYNICGYTAFGTLYCWGIGDSGQLGNGILANVLTPTELRHDPHLVDWRASLTNTCGLTDDGAAYCWGNNYRGGVGDGTQVDRIVPTPLAGGLRFASLTVGRNHSCGITTSGETYCWGDNDVGQLGDGTTTTRLTPVRVQGGETFTAVSTSWQTTCALTVARRAFCWGSGPLGTGDGQHHLVPTAVIGGHTFSQISVGPNHACALTASGEAWCWGLNNAGQLGSEVPVGFTPQASPSPVVTSIRFEEISLGWGYTCGRSSTQDVYCWGYNEYGQLGDGSRTARAVPKLVVLP